MTDRSHGDLAVGSEPEALEQRRRAVVDAPWVWLHQVHGAEVVVAESPGDGAGRRADAVVTAAVDTPIAVQVADCAPVFFADSGGVIGVAHAGWRGLSSGVLEATVETMVGLGATSPVAVLGPCIRPSSYEFGETELAGLEDRLGPEVRGRTSWGTPALDMPAAVAAALRRLGIELVATIGGCTAEAEATRWSHRARGDVERQAMVAWRGAA